MPEPDDDVPSDFDDIEDAADATVRAAYKHVRHLHQEAGRGEPPPVGIPVSKIFDLTFDEFMAAPPVDNIDWSQATLRDDEGIVARLSDPIEVFLTSTRFDEMDGPPVFDHTFYHLFSYFDCAARRLLFAHDDEREVVRYVVVRLYSFDFDTYIEKYAQLDSIAKSGNAFAQCRMYALLMWMAYVACVTTIVPTYLPPKSVDPSILKEGRDRATRHLSDLAIWMLYAKTDLQLATAMMLRRGAEDICFRILEAGVAAGAYGWESRPRGVKPSPSNVINVFGDIMSSQIHMATVDQSAIHDQRSVSLGDNIHAESGATVVNRSTVVHSLNHSSDKSLVDDLRQLARIVEGLENREASDLTEALIVEATGPRRRALLKTLWQRLREIAPAASAAVTVGTKLHELLN